MECVSAVGDCTRFRGGRESDSGRLYGRPIGRKSNRAWLASHLMSQSPKGKIDIDPVSPSRPLHNGKAFISAASRTRRSSWRRFPRHPRNEHALRRPPARTSTESQDGGNCDAQHFSTLLAAAVVANGSLFELALPMLRLTLISH